MSRCLLLAGGTRLPPHLARQLREAERVERLRDVVLGLAILAVVAASIWLLARFVERCQRRRSKVRPRLLFLALCRAHRLRWSERWILWQIARGQRLRDPGRVFLEPERLDLANVPVRLRSRAALIEQLRRRLFSEQDLPTASRQAPGAAKNRPTAAAPALGIPPLETDPAWDVAAWLSSAPNDDR